MLGYVDDVPILIKYQSEFVAITGNRDAHSNWVRRQERVLHGMETLKQADASIDIIDVPSWIDVVLLVEGNHDGMINHG